jgi:hypothetical protein
MLATAIPIWAAPRELARDGKSAFVICHAPDAPTSVVTAAQDLRRYIAKVSGAELPIVQEPREPVICLGEGPAARARGKRQFSRHDRRPLTQACPSPKL